MAEPTRIDDCLSVRGGELYLEDCRATELIERFGSPLFAISESQLRLNARRYHEAFSRHWPDGPVDILPAFKANWTLATRRVLSDAGVGADVYSEGELRGVLESGVDPERVSVNGGGKSDGFLRRCLEAGVRITVEDLDEPRRIDSIARELGVVAKVRLRVKPNFPNLWRATDFAQEYASIDIGIQAYKGGIPAQYLVELGREVLTMKNVELTGLHLHLGRHHPSLWYWRGAMRRYAALIAHLCRSWGGYRPVEIDVGGGFATHRDPFDNVGLREDVLRTVVSYPFEQALRLLGENGRYRAMSSVIERFFAKMPTKERAPTIEEYGQATAGTLRSELHRQGVDTAEIRLQVEPGRGMYGDTAIHLTTVKKVKRQTQPIDLRWVLTDTTYFFFAGGQFEYDLHDFRVANKADQEATEVADIVGHSCAADRFLPFARVPKIVEGDVIALFDMGAYQESSASNFNALPRPASVLVRGTDADVIRRAETLDDVFRRDVVPNRLMRQARAAE